MIKLYRFKWRVDECCYFYRTVAKIDDEFVAKRLVSEKEEWTCE